MGTRPPEPLCGTSTLHYQLIVSSARRHLTEDLPGVVATAVFEFITGPLLEKPPCVGKQLRPPRTATVLAIG